MAFFNKEKIGEIRPHQLITTFGPGSIIDARKDSVVMLDTNYWEKGKPIYDSRLASYLGVKCFYEPRTSKGNNDLPAISFPYYHVCSNVKCSSLFDIRDNFDKEKYLAKGPVCPHCGARAYPARFILMCKSGHMEDFPWSWWVHKGQNTKCKNFKMYSIGNTSTLDDIVVECLDCGAKRNMSGATQEKFFDGYKCSGRHPSKPNVHGEKCNEHVIPTQRGASNVYFPVIRSAISIPPWTDPLYNLIDEHLNLIEQMEEMGIDDAEDRVYKKNFYPKYTFEQFSEALQKRRRHINEFKEMKVMEYTAITHHDDPAYRDERKYFKAEEDELPNALKKYFARVIKITRLREVMVLLGFTRVVAPDPDSDEKIDIVSLNKNATEPWLPAVETNGEGIFIEFNNDTIKAWLENPEVAVMSKKYHKCYELFSNSRGWKQNNPKDGKYVLLHTFAHLMIKEMSLCSGYSSSAIKERIYSSDKMSGVLLYTGSADKEGSLGGLVELGNIDKLLPILKNAFENALICTNDPECMTNEPTVDMANGAACYSCSMVAETACENGNRMLDRGLVVPIVGRENQAYFRALVGELCNMEV